MRLAESGEMYLESILVLSEKLERVRSIDIVEYMNYSKPSVSRAVSLLKSGGYIDVDENGYITLTSDGYDTAHTIYERHRILTDALMSLGVDRETAADDACRIEHCISSESFEAVKRHFEK